MNQILLGNCVSFLAAVLLGLASWTKKSNRVFIYQIAENVVLAMSSVVFGSYAAAVSTLLAAARCAVIIKGRYSRLLMTFFAAATFLLGIVTNSRGWLGLLPVIASVEFTVCNYFLTDIKGIKWSLLVNTALWDYYAFAIRDYVSGIAWAITITLTSVSLVSIYREERQQAL